eukprot:4804482-Amphidinium_carterae.1
MASALLPVPLSQDVTKDSECTHGKHGASRAHLYIMMSRAPCERAICHSSQHSVLPASVAGLMDPQQHQEMGGEKRPTTRCIS